MEKYILALNYQTAFEMQDIYLSKLDFQYFLQLRKYGTILLIFCTQVVFLDVDGVLHPAFVQYIRQQFRPTNMRLLKQIIVSGC